MDARVLAQAKARLMLWLHQAVLGLRVLEPGSGIRGLSVWGLSQ